MNKLIFFIFFSLIAFKLFSQNTSNNDMWKKLDYLYNHKDWAELIKISRLINPEQKDSSTLNLYLAVSHFNLTEYRIANNYFIKAYKNDTSKFIKEKYYNSLIANYDFMEARKLSTDITDSMFREEIGVRKYSFVISSSAYFGTVFSNDFNNQIKPNETDTIFNNLYTDQLNNYFSANIDLMLNKFYNLDISLSQFNDNRTQLVILDTLNQSFDVGSKQNNTFFKIQYNSTKIDWYVGSNINTHNEKYIYFYEKDTSLLTATRYLSKIYLYFFANADYNFAYSSIGINLACGDLFYQKQFQLGLNFKFYPFANDNLVLSLSPTYINTKEIFTPNYSIDYYTYNSNVFTNQLITNIGVDCRFSDKLKLSVSADFGGINILHASSNFFIYNNEITSLYKISTEYSFNKFISVFLMYSYNKFNHYYIDNKNIYNVQNFSNQDFTGGLSYKF